MPSQRDDDGVTRRQQCVTRVVACLLVKRIQQQHSRHGYLYVVPSVPSRVVWPVLCVYIHHLREVCSRRCTTRGILCQRMVIPEMQLY